MPTRRTAVVVGIALAVFLALTVLVWTGSLDGVDSAFRRFGDRHHSDAAVTVARILTDVLQPVVDTVLLLGGAAVLARRRRELTPLVIAVVVILAVSIVV